MWRWEHFGLFVCLPFWVEEFHVVTPLKMTLIEGLSIRGNQIVCSHVPPPGGGMGKLREMMLNRTSQGNGGNCKRSHTPWFIEYCNKCFESVNQRQKKGKNIASQNQRIKGLRRSRDRVIMAHVESWDVWIEDDEMPDDETLSQFSDIAPQDDQHLIPLTK